MTLTSYSRRPVLRRTVSETDVSVKQRRMAIDVKSFIGCERKKEGERRSYGNGDLGVDDDDDKGLC